MCDKFGELRSHVVPVFDDSWLFVFLLFCSWQPSWKRHQTDCGGSVQTWVQGPRPGGQMDQWWVISNAECVCWRPELSFLFLPPVDGQELGSQKYVSTISNSLEEISPFVQMNLNFDFNEVLFFLSSLIKLSPGFIACPFHRTINVAYLFLLLNYAGSLVTYPDKLSAFPVNYFMPLYIYLYKTHRESDLTWTTFQWVLSVLCRSKQRRRFHSAAQGLTPLFAFFVIVAHSRGGQAVHF